MLSMPKPAVGDPLCAYIGSRARSKITCSAHRTRTSDFGPARRLRPLPGWVASGSGSIRPSGRRGHTLAAVLSPEPGRNASKNGKSRVRVVCAPTSAAHLGFRPRPATRVYFGPARRHTHRSNAPGVFTIPEMHLDCRTPALKICVDLGFLGLLDPPTHRSHVGLGGDIQGGALWAADGKTHHTLM